MPKKVRELKAFLRAAGWIEIAGGGKGSHTKWTYPRVARRVTLSGKDSDDAHRYQKRTWRERLPKRRMDDEHGELMKPTSHYSVIIQWSDEDKVYIVTLPEWGGCHTHGSTYDEAARNARELLEVLMADEKASGNELPTPHEFQYPGPSGFTYQFSPGYKVPKVKRATA